MNIKIVQEPFCFPIFANICQDNKIMVSQLIEPIMQLRTRTIIRKISQGERKLKNERITLLTQILKADIEICKTFGLHPMVFNMAQCEPMADEALKLVSEDTERK